MILTTVLQIQAQADLEARTQQASSYNDKGVAAVEAGTLTTPSNFSMKPSAYAPITPSPTAILVRLSITKDGLRKQLQL